MYCNYCGNKVDDSTLICTKCGNPCVKVKTYKNTGIFTPASIFLVIVLVAIGSMIGAGIGANIYGPMSGPRTLEIGKWAGAVLGGLLGLAIIAYRKSGN